MPTDKPTVVRKDTEGYKEGAIVVNQVIVRPINRQQKDIADWRAFWRQGEQFLFPQVILLFDLYDDCMVDGHFTGIWQKRIDAVLNKNLRYVDKDGKKIDEMDRVINSLVFRDVIKTLLRQKLFGRIGMEFIPGEKLEMAEIPVKHIKPYLRKIVFEQSGVDGFDYMDMPNLWVVHKPYDLGLMLKVSYYVLLKRGVIGDWADFIQRFGIPPQVIKYDAYDIKTKQELTNVLEEAGSSLNLMIPRQADYEIHPEGTNNNATGELQDKFRNACNEEMSIIVLGNTETTSNSNGGSRAKSEVHAKQQLEVTKSDLAEVQLLLSSDIFQNILRSYALPVVDGGYFEFESEVDLDELSTRKDIDIALSSKIPIGDDYFYDTYKIPKPDNYDELKAKMEEEKQAKLNPPAPGSPAPAPGAKKDKKLKPKEKKLNASLFNQFLSFFANGQPD